MSEENTVESTDSMEGIDHVCDNDTDGLTEMTDLNDIPSALIIAHIDTSVFEDKDSQVRKKPHIFNQISSLKKSF